VEAASFTRDFESWMKEVLEVQQLSLRELCEGNLEGGLLYCGLRRMSKRKLCRRAPLSIEK